MILNWSNNYSTHWLIQNRLSILNSFAGRKNMFSFAPAFPNNLAVLAAIDNINYWEE